MLGSSFSSLLKFLSLDLKGERTGFLFLRSALAVSSIFNRSITHNIEIVQLPLLLTGRSTVYTLSLENLSLLAIASALLSIFSR